MVMVRIKTNLSMLSTTCIIVRIENPRFVSNERNGTMKQFIIHICVIALWLDATVPAETCVENCIIRCNSLSGAHVCLRCSDTASSYVHALSSTAVPAASEQLTPELFTRGRTHEYTGKNRWWQCTDQRQSTTTVLADF